MFCIFTSAWKWMLLPGLLLPTTRHSGKRFSGQKKKKKKSEKSAFIFNVILSKLEIQIQNFNCATVKHYFLFSWLVIVTHDLWFLCNSSTFHTTCILLFSLNTILQILLFPARAQPLLLRHSITLTYIYISHIIYTVLLLKANLLAGFFTFCK